MALHHRAVATRVLSDLNLIGFNLGGPCRGKCDKRANDQGGVYLPLIGRVGACVFVFDKRCDCPGKIFQNPTPPDRLRFQRNCSRSGRT